MTAATKDFLWTPSIGSWIEKEGVHFRVWAPNASSMEVVRESPRGFRVLLAKEPGGYFSGISSEMRAGDQYKFLVDGKGPFPDPASRFQPQGVHGPSMIDDPARFAWTDARWTGIPAERRVVYELHLGTFTPLGTLAAAAEKLPYLLELGVNVIELMPVAEFAGSRNWGYDGVFPYAPAHAYGTPDDLRRFVNEAHAQGLAVVMDVVYNHLGPEGNYTGAFSPDYFTSRHRSPWGDGINFDGEHSRPVRDFFIENALHWIHGYHIDGLRLDATHAIVDDSPKHFIDELASKVQSARTQPTPFLIAEDHRNLASLVSGKATKGWNLDGVWADDFHHVVRRFLVGDHESYYRDYQGNIPELVTTIRQGWLFTGQISIHLGVPRGTLPGALPYNKFVFFIQNHDQVGNRAFGERLGHQVDAATYRAIVALWLLLPQTPMLFMGEEWGASTPFLFFTDHPPELGAKVTEGRRDEFKTFSAFANPETRERIPDPQSEKTFAQSALQWRELDEPSHTCFLRLYRRLLHLRASLPALQDVRRDALLVEAIDDETVAFCRQAPKPVLVVARLRGSGSVSLASAPRLAEFVKGWSWKPLLDTEDTEFSLDGRKIEEASAAPFSFRFSRPGALIWQGEAHD